MPSLKELARLVRYYSLVSTTTAGSGHPSSCLSAADIMTVLMFGGVFRARLEDPDYINNDRLIFSKGHAAPLFYSLYAAAGKISHDEMKSLRDFDSRLEGHPTLRFPYTEAATGSLGQGLSIGVGMAINAKYLDQLPYRTYVLMGDSEVAEGQVWEAMEIAAHYKLDNLVGILDVNRLGERGETLFGHDTSAYKRKAEAFGWNAVVVNGHSIAAIQKAFAAVQKKSGKPTLIIAKTIKGKGVSLMEDKEGWHGRVLKPKELGKAIMDIGPIDLDWVGSIKKPLEREIDKKPKERRTMKTYTKGELVATRDAYGNALVVAGRDPNVVVLDAETSNSTRSDKFKFAYPKRFFEMYIAEQNMVSTALGLSRRGKKPFVSTFAAFFTRAYDQIRMLQYSDPNLVLCGSHAGVSIGADGSSQMALEDMAMMRAVSGSTVLYPSDAVSMEQIVHIAADHHGLTYIRSTRAKTPVLYTNKTTFKIGGSQTVRKSTKDQVTIFAAGVTLHEAIKAADLLKKEKIIVRVVDMYSVKPIDKAAIKKACKDTKALIVVEDHYLEGGLYEAICASGVVTRPVHSLAVRKMPRSGTPEELLAYMGIDAEGIMKQVKKII